MSTPWHRLAGQPVGTHPHQTGVCSGTNRVRATEQNLRAQVHSMAARGTPSNQGALLKLA
jgi:hypothetical protein